jgi:acetolactate synthase-1/2/3 large subunit
VSPARREFGVARAVASCLERGGVDHLFLMTGGDQSLWIELQRTGIRVVLARSEASAVYMADGYARASGKPTAVYGQWGPGAANVAAALADPFWAHSPVVAITSAVGTDTARRNEYQELDQPALFEAVTKWNRTLPTPGRATELTSGAVLAAMSGCPGPVHLDIPRDFFEQACDDDAAHLFGSASSPPAPDPSALERAAAVIEEAVRPVVMAGSGVLLAGAEADLARLAEGATLPVVTTAGGKGAFDEAHPLSLGVAGRYSRKVANDLLARADVVLAAGTRLGALATDGYRLPAQGARIIQIDIDPDVLGTTRPVEVAIQADLSSALAGLADRLAGSSYEPPSAWIEEVRADVAAWNEELSRLVEQRDNGESLQGEQVLTALRAHASDDDTLVSDTGYMAAWTAAIYQLRKAGRFYFRCGGSLGWAFAAALGVQLARPMSRTFCVIGDGGLGYHIGDLETAVRLGIPTVTIVLNNRSLAYEYHIQKHLYDETIVAEVNDFADTDYGAVARAFGAFGERVATMEDLDLALSHALSERRPALIDVVIDKEQLAPVTSYESVLERLL